MNKLIHGTWQEELPKLEDNSVDLIIIDPPYLITKEKWDKEEQVTEVLSENIFRILKPSGNFYCWGSVGEKNQLLIDWLYMFKNTGWYFKDWITWKKQRGMGNRRGWLYTREEILWFVKDNKQFIWNKENQYSNIPRKKSGFNKKAIEVTGRNLLRYSNVWIDINESTLGDSGVKFAKKRIESGFFHFTPKPKKAIERIILAHTKENDVVLDCFLGSGTTMQVCNELGRNCIGIEKELEYYEHCQQYE